MQSKKIRLLHLIKSTDMGGIEKSTILYSNYLINKLEFIGIYASKGFYDNSDFINQEVKRFYPQYPIRQKKYFFKNLYNLLSILRQNEISHLHYHHRIFIPFIFFIKLISPKIKIMYTHHSVFNDSINNLIIGNKIIALNEATKRDLPKRFWQKTIMIPHGVQIGKTLKPLSVPPKNIGYVGRFVIDKGLINLIKAFKVINKEIPDTKLILVGDGPLKNEMIKIINNLNIAEKVLFKMPSISEDEIYSDIDILVLPSEKLEGFGLVVLEAMSLCIPVVVSNLKPLIEIIIDKLNGIIIKNNLSFDLLNLIKNNNLLNTIRFNAIKTLKEKYSFEMVAEKYFNEIYTKV